MAQGRPGRHHAALHARYVAPAAVLLQHRHRFLPDRRGQAVLERPVRRGGGPDSQRPLPRLRALRAADPGRGRGLGTRDPRDHHRDGWGGARRAEHPPDRQQHRKHQSGVRRPTALPRRRIVCVAVHAGGGPDRERFGQRCLSPRPTAASALQSTSCGEPGRPIRGRRGRHGAFRREHVLRSGQQHAAHVHVELRRRQHHYGADPGTCLHRGGHRHGNPRRNRRRRRAERAREDHRHDHGRQPAPRSPAGRALRGCDRGYGPLRRQQVVRPRQQYAPHVRLELRRWGQRQRRQTGARLCGGGN